MIIVTNFNEKETVNKIRSSIAEFIEKDVKKKLIELEKNYEEVDYPQTLMLIMKSFDDRGFALDEEGQEYIRTECIRDAIEETSLNEYYDDFHVELEGVSGNGYVYDDGSWLRKIYYHCGFADFSIEIDTKKMEIAFIAKCSLNFWIMVDGAPGDYRPTRDEYVDEIELMITDKAKVDALDKIVEIEKFKGIELEELGDEGRLTESEKEILVSIGYFDDDNDGCYDFDDYPDATCLNVIKMPV